jgi:Uma2 family endonuclease
LLCRMARVKVGQPRVTYADLERAPEDGRRYELYDGEVFVVPAPLPRHQIVGQLIADTLRDYAARQGGLFLVSPIDIVFSEYDVLQPDIVFFKADRRHLVNLDAVIRHAPDLCVEVLSPSTEEVDRGRKMQMFARYGVPECWIVDPRQETIEVYRLDGPVYTMTAAVAQNDTLESPTIEGLTCRAVSIFPAGD